jgi:shikimate dehydrogenase
MFDGEGFVRGLLTKGERLQGRQVLMFGAGGAGSAIACALAGAGVASIRIVNPDTDRTVKLVAALKKAFPACDIAEASGSRQGFDIIVNASPVGMKPDDGPPGDLGTLTSEMLMADVVVSSTPTAFIQKAMDSGCRWANGHDMHSGQIEAIMGFFINPTLHSLAATR